MTSLKRNKEDENNNNDSSNDKQQSPSSVKICKYNHNNNTTTTRDNYFYLIWRNNYTRSCIRNKVLENREIKLNIKYLKRNHQYLSVLSDKDKIDNNIYFKLVIKDISYLNKNRYKYLINSLCITIKEEEEEDEEELNCGLLHEGLIRLKVVRLTTLTGNLPQSIRYLDLSGLSGYTSNIDELLLHLPSNLKELELPNQYIIKTNEKIILPQSLEVFKYSSAQCSKLMKFVVPPNRVYKDIKARAEEPSEVEWLLNQCWIIDLEFNIRSEDSVVPLPSHIKHLSLSSRHIIGENMLPKGLVSLIINKDIYCSINLISDMPYLKYLEIKELHIKLQKGMLPSTLETLLIWYHDHPLEVGVLPEGLTELYFHHYDIELQVGVLPCSLKRLTLSQYQESLKPYVLPYGLESLCMDLFKDPLERNVLPTSLTRLQLTEYESEDGAFKEVDQLYSLRYLYLPNLIPSLVRVISNCRTLSIEFSHANVEFDLRDAQIEHLVLIFHLYGEEEYDDDELLVLNRSLVPLNVQSLRLQDCRIESNDVVPWSCKYLYSNQEDLDTSLLPKTTKYKYIQKQ